MVEKIFSNLNKNSFLKSFIFTAFLLLAILLFLPVRYEVNDDFAMITILSGNGGFPSNSYAVFLNPIMSYLLFFLYKLSPSIPWYGLVIYSLFYLGWSLIISVLLRSNKGISLVLSIPLLLTLFVLHSCFITFTSVTLFLLLGVFLCILEYAIIDDTPFKKRRNYTIFLASCLYLSFLLRWNLVIYSIILLISTFFLMKRHQIKKIIPLSVVLISLIFMNIVFIYYIDLQHQSFREYNNLRGEFHGTDKGEIHDQITPHAAEKAGWSYEDYLLFKYHWFLYDNNTFNAQRLKIFLEENQPQKNKKIFVSFFGKKIKESFIESKNITLLLIISIISIIIYRFKYLSQLSKIDILKRIILLGIVANCIIFLMYYRFVPRIYGPLYIYLFSLTYFLCNQKNKVLSDSINKYQGDIITKILLIVCFIFGLFFARLELINYYNELYNSYNYKSNLKEISNIIEERYSESNAMILQMIPLEVFHPEYVHPLKEYNDFPHIKIFPLGWMINSPYYDMILENMNISSGHDFLKFLVSSKDTLLCLFVRSKDEKASVLYLWESYYSRHVLPGGKIKFIPLFEFLNKDGIGVIFYNIRCFP